MAEINSLGQYIFVIDGIRMTNRRWLAGGQRPLAVFFRIEPLAGVRYALAINLIGREADVVECPLPRNSVPTRREFSTDGKNGCVECGKI